MIYVLVNSIHLPGVDGKPGGQVTQVDSDKYPCLERGHWLEFTVGDQCVATPIANVRYTVLTLIPPTLVPKQTHSALNPAISNEASKPAKKTPPRK